MSSKQWGAVLALASLVIAAELASCTAEQRTEARTAHDELCAKVLEYSDDYPLELREARTVCLLREATKRDEPKQELQPDGGAP